MPKVMKSRSTGAIAAREERRKACVRWCLQQQEVTGKVNLAEAARRFGVTRESTNEWMRRYRDGGWEGLVDQHFQPKSPALSERDLEQLREILLLGAAQAGFRDDLWTTPRIAQVIKRRFGVRHHPDHVGRLLRERLGFTWQKPQRVPREKDLDRTQRWLQEDWPRIKGGPKSSVQRSSSSTKAVSRASQRSVVPGHRAAKHRG